VKLSRKAALKEQAEGGSTGGDGAPQQQNDRTEQQPVH